MRLVRGEEVRLAQEAEVRHDERRPGMRRGTPPLTHHVRKEAVKGGGVAPCLTDPCACPGVCVGDRGEGREHLVQVGDELGEHIGCLGEVGDAGIEHVGDVPRHVPLAVAPGTCGD